MEVLAIVSGVMLFAGYAIYAFQVLRKGIRPNTTSWILWAFGDIVTCATYIGVTDDWREFLSSAVSAASCLTLVIIFAFFGKLQKIDTWDKVIIATDLIVILLWWIFQSALFANLLIQISAVITFIPIIRSTARNAKHEKPHAWFMWTIAYGLTAVIVVVLNTGHWAEIIYPLNYALLHAIVGLLALGR